jgi:fatty acid desaturase
MLKKMPVQITDIDMPFISMVWFMVKWAFATIPAIIIIWMVVGSIPVIIGGLLGSL